MKNKTKIKFFLEIFFLEKKSVFCYVFSLILFLVIFFCSWEISVCGARYKTRPGLTYHYGHSHKEGTSDENSRDSLAQNPTSSSQVGMPPVGNTPMPGAMGMPSGGGLMQTNPSNLLGDATPNVPVPQLQGPPTQGHVYQDSYVSFLNHPAGTAFFFTLLITVI